MVQPESASVEIDLLNRPAALWVDRGTATRRLMSRLESGCVDQITVSAALTPEIWAPNGHLSPQSMLACGVHNRIAEVVSRSGLIDAEPPDEIHAMGRGPRAAGGAYGYADLVSDALEAAGMPITDGERILDFGCSSGRIVRVLAAAWPECHFEACDPNQAAVDWARTNLGSIANFHCSGLQPPLNFPPASFDAIYAVSIWSHFAPSAAASWFAEMFRLVRPGGRLVFTTHGWHTLNHESRNDGVHLTELAVAAQALFTSGHHWFDSFGPDGDWGVKHPEWGYAVFTPEWILSTILPEWQLNLYEPGVVENNQDLWVISKTRARTRDRVRHALAAGGPTELINRSSRFLARRTKRLISRTPN